MSYVFHNDGELVIAHIFMGGELTALGTPVTIRLFTGPSTPAKHHTRNDITELAGGGYAPITLDVSDWSEVPTSSNQITLTHPSITFAFTSDLGQTVYGYFAEREGKLIFSETLDTPVSPSTNTPVVVYPRLILGRLKIIW